MASPITTNDPETYARDPQGWSASLYNKSAAFVYSPKFTAPVLEILAARPGEKIIDLGCGSGEVTVVIEKIVKQAPGGVVVGVDYSESMVLRRSFLAIVIILISNRSRRPKKPA
jgi:trans-aconitate methyltransferase